MSARARYASLIVQGVIIWFIAAMCIRYAILAAWQASSVAMALVFAISVPLCCLGIEVTHKTVRGQPGELIRTAAVIALVGALLDGIAITWTPQLYSLDGAGRAAGGAWLLWIVGTILAWGLVRDRR